MGDGHCGHSHFGDDFPDQVVDHARHNGIQTGGWFIKKDDFGIRGDRTGQPNAFLHAAGQFAWVFISNIWLQSDPAQLFNGDLAGVRF